MLNLDFGFYDWNVISGYVIKGLYFSVFLTVVATLGGIFFGTLLALMRLSGVKWLDAPAAIYVNGMRSIPLVMVLLWFFLLVPLAIGRPIGAEYSAIITFVAFEAAYFSEIMRAGIQSIPRGQYEAAEVLGYTRTQTFMKIILPQVFKRILPAMGNEVITLVKDTSLAFVLGIMEMFTQAKAIAAAQTSMMPYVIAGLIYWVFNFVVVMVLNRVEKRMNYYHD